MVTTTVGPPNLNQQSSHIWDVSSILEVFRCFSFLIHTKWDSPCHWPVTHVPLMIPGETEYFQYLTQNEDSSIASRNSVVDMSVNHLPVLVKISFSERVDPAIDSLY